MVSLSKIFKKIVLLAAFAVLGWSLNSCKSDDEVVTQKSEKELLEGKWNMVTGEYYQDGELVYSEDLREEGCEYDYYHFYQDGKKDEILHYGGCESENYSGIWEYNEATKELKTVDADDDYTMIFKVLNLESSTLEIQLINDDGDIVPEQVKMLMILNR